MEPLHYCEKCKKPILKTNEILKDLKYYHKKCLNINNQNDINDKNEEKIKKYTHERRLTMNIKNKYLDGYFGKTLMTEVVRPYLQFKYKIKKNKYLELIPQISMYFNEIDENKAHQFIKNGGLDLFKKELKEVLGEDYTIIVNNIVLGSFLSKICIVIKNKVKAIGNMGTKIYNKLHNFITRKNEESKLVKDAIECLNTHSFKCIEGLKPNAIKFINQNTIESKEQNEKIIKEFLNEKINENFDAKSSYSLETKISDLSLDNKDITDEELDDIYLNIKNIAENEEFELKQEIENININQNFNERLKINLDYAFKESIFEFRITGLVIINNENQREIYEQEKNKCPNCETKILFHATKIDFSSKILTTNFKIGRDNWYGLGVYFADQFDYAKYYYKREENFATIPKLNDSFSIVVSEVYYDKSKFKQIYDYRYEKNLNKSPSEEDLKGKYLQYTVPKNSIHYIEVDGESGYVVNQNKKIINNYGISIGDLKEDRFVGKEYCVTCKEQIYPLYGLNFQRVDYCVIWRDSNFNSFTWKEPLRKNKEIIKEMTGYNLYTESDTLSALKLIWRKRFNKIILITNVGYNCEGKLFVDKARKILQFDVMALFFTNDFNHLSWIKDYPNSLVCFDDYTIKDYVFNFNEDGFKKIRDNVREFFQVELQEPKDPFAYPLFEKYKDSFYLYSDIDCSEYKDL